MLELIAPCHFGLEAVLKREIIDLGYDVKEVTDGRVVFYGDEEAIAYANVFLRTAERIMIQVGEFKAETWDELFEGTKALEWENYIPSDGRFEVVKASGIKSKLFSASDMQSIVKKAVVEHLKRVYHINWFDGNNGYYPIRVFIKNDMVSIGLDTTGDSLHKRGYRTLTSKAPIAENLASALIMLTPWREDRILVDPFCGSGTFPIEAAMMAANMAPGMNRNFTAEKWTNLIPRQCWYDAVTEANDNLNLKVETDIQGYDIDEQMVRIARANAEKCGVEHLIHFQTRPVSELSHPKKYGFIITNPPYGERIEDKETLPKIYGELADRYHKLDSWSLYMITSYDKAESIIGRKADKNRKIYNGMLKTYFLQFNGPKPPKKNK